MKSYEVIILENAEKKIKDIYFYVQLISYSHEIAMNLVKKIRKEINTLSTFPLRVPLMNAEPFRSKGYRRMVVNNYSVYFIVIKDKVIVVDVLSNLCDVNERLNRISIN